jgi:hypothetical protein
VLHSRLHLSDTLVKRRSRRRLETYQQSTALKDIRKHCTEKSFSIFLTQTKLLGDKTPVLSDERTPQGESLLMRSYSLQVREVARYFDLVIWLKNGWRRKRRGGDSVNFSTCVHHFVSSETLATGAWAYTRWM